MSTVVMMAFWKPALLLAALICWYARRHRFRPGAVLLGLQIASSFCTEAIAGRMACLDISNLRLYDLYAPVEFLLFCSYMYLHTSRVRLRRGLIIASLVFAVIYAWELPHAWNASEFVSYTYMVGSFALAIGFVTLLYDLAARADTALVRQPKFWAFLGLAGFFGGMIPILGLLNLLTKEDQEMASYLFSLNDLLFTFCNVTFIIGCSIRSSDNAPIA